MSQEQLSALASKLNEDAGLLEKFKGAADLNAAVAIASEAGFDVTKEDWLNYQATKVLKLSDEELEGVAGGKSPCRLTCGDIGLERLGTCGDKG
jgi:predicted ribosomally synthesized peptide with nif11-like leader